MKNREVWEICRNEQTGADPSAPQAGPALRLRAVGAPIGLQAAERRLPLSIVTSGLLSVLIALIAAACFRAPAFNDASTAGVDEAVVNFDIPSQPLSTALLEFGRQASVEFVIPSAPLAGAESHGVRDRLFPSDALDQLLQCTGFEGRLDDGVVLLRRRSAVSPPPASRGRLERDCEMSREPILVSRRSVPDDTLDMTTGHIRTWARERVGRTPEVPTKADIHGDGLVRRSRLIEARSRCTSERQGINAGRAAYIERDRLSWPQTGRPWPNSSFGQLGLLRAFAAPIGAPRP